MHHIQAKILQKLLYTEQINYARLRPTNVESNHFAYHLDQLIKDGFIAKTDKAYRLTPKGLAYVDRLSQGIMKERLQPHIVTAIDITTPGGKTLLFQRTFQPYINLVGLPNGKLHYDESIADAARRELYEKTGLEGIPLTHRGMVYIRATQANETIGRVLYHVFHGEVETELPVHTPPERGVSFWDEHTKFDTAQCMPGFIRIKRLLREPSELFFAELNESLGT